MLDELRWLHLSDLHLHSEGDLYSQRTVMNALIRDVEERVSEFGNLHFALISGDLAYSGTSSEYLEVREFVDRLASVTGLNCGDFFVVPGNHDVDRSQAEYQYHGVRARVTSQAEVDIFLGKRADVGHLLTRQKAFWAFEAGLDVTEERNRTPDGLGYAAQVDVDGFLVGVVAINTAWLSGPDDDQARLVIGERHFMEVLELAEAGQPQLLLAMGHHPMEWLHEWDRASCEAGLLRRVDLYHRGHEHRAAVGLASHPRSPCIMVAAGAAHTIRHDTNSYNLIKVRIGDGECDIATMTYSATSHTFIADMPTSAPVNLRGSLSGTASEMVDALLQAIPTVADRRHYISALIVGHAADVPVQTAGGYVFAAPAAAEATGGLHRETIELLRLRNLLRAYSPDVELQHRFDSHRATITAFSALLTRLSKEDNEFKRECESREQQCARMLGVRPSGDRPHAKALLEDLMLGGDSPSLIEAARRFQRSSDPELGRLSTRALVQGLVTSDERDDVREAVLLAAELLEHSDATSRDWVLAATAAEVAGDYVQAARLVCEALELWPGDMVLRTEARGFSRRLNSREIARLLQTGKPSEGGGDA
jgi:hypothetical protein